MNEPYEREVPEPQCEHVSPLGRCQLVAGHPVGPGFDFFTDYHGHLYEGEPAGLYVAEERPS